MIQTSLLAIAGRTVFVYLLMLVMIRVLGKRTIGNLTAFDMLVALIMGDLAGTAIYGQVSLFSAAVAVTTLAALHYANSWLAFDHPRLARLLEGEPAVIVEDGQFVPAALARERMSESEARAELRLAGIEDLADVKVARVERDGRISVLRQDGRENDSARD
jgi:uncharacterized membrane protein YcaP (DUF421 family)